MEKLWKKESNITDLYVDLFANARSQNEFREWNGQLNNRFWNHCFYNSCSTVSPNKSNETSNMFRMKGNLIFRDEIIALSGLSVEDRYKSSIELYNRSLIFAETGTENVSLAYANRSAGFFQLKKYDKCLIDIDHAKKANYPKKLMPKLDKRKEDCLRLLQTHVEIKRKFEQPKLDFDADENFPCMANVVEIKRNDEFGRLLEAKCDIDVGKTVLVEESFVSVGTGDVQVLCFTCLRRNMCFVACPQCTDAVFCSDDCMSRNNVHKMSCGSFYYRLPMNIQVTLQSLLVAVDLIPNVEDLMDFVQSNLKLDNHHIPANVLDSRRKYGLFLKLHIRERPGNAFLAYQVYTSILTIPSIKRVFDSDRKQRFLMHLVVHHLLIRQNNNFLEVAKENQFNVSSVACVLSLVNHSCTPNLLNFAVDNQEVCVTIRPIQKGEQLFISYSGQDDTTVQRQAFLKQYFGFECKCGKCRPCDRNRNHLKVHPFFQTSQRFSSVDIDKENYMKHQQMCVDFLKKYGNLPWSEEIDDVVNIFKKVILHS